MTAKAVATLDHLSGGRLVAGSGARSGAIFIRRQVHSRAGGCRAMALQIDVIESSFQHLAPMREGAARPA